MSSPTIDYDALAAQHGGTVASPAVDYDALAAQHGGTATAKPADDTGVWASLKRSASNISHLPGAIADAFTKPPQDDAEKAIIGNTPGTRFEGDAKISLAMKRLFADPMKAERDKAAQMRQQAATQSNDQANNAYNGTNHLANMHEIAGYVPVLGPMAADMTQRYLSGDKSGAVTDLATAVAGPKVAEGGINAVTRVIAKGAPKVAEAMYQSALKPSTTNVPAENLAAVRTGLNAAIPISEEGVSKLNGLVQDLNNKIKAQIASNPTAPINKFQVASRLNKPATAFAKQASPTADLNTIADVGNDFLDTKPGTITAEDAQAIKQGTYKQIGDRAYGEASTARVEAEKSLARGLKEELESHFPEIKKLNADESQYFDLKGALEKAVNRAANRQTIPARLGGPFAGALAGGGTSAIFGHEAGAAVGLGVYALKTVLDDPTLQSKLAIVISKTAKMPPRMAMARIAKYSNALAQSQTGDQSQQ